MQPIQYQYINNKLFPTVSRELTRFMGQTNYISKYIPEIAVNSSKGAIGADLDNTAYNLKNMYGGTALGHVFNDYGKYKGRLFNMEPEEFYIGIDINRIEEINEIYQQDEKRAGQEILTYIGQKLANRIGLLKERNLANEVTNDDFYGSSNEADLSATKISSWTETDIDNFFKTFMALTKYMNYATGGVIFNDQMEYQDVQQKFYILIPIDIYIELQSLFRMFKDYITYLSNLPDGKYKALRPDLFNAVTSGITVVGTAFRVADDKELDSEYQIKNLTDIWTGNYIYMFTTSSNIMDLASIKEVVYLQNDMRYFDFLGNNLWRTRTKRQTLASNPLGFARLKLKLTD
ncbi:phage capsid protein [Brachyspira intermedia]|uniref:phage capsid protein n=1 Tax=Brachyspira intermedia TaxID=84377 RepID=UPI0030074B5D